MSRIAAMLLAMTLAGMGSAFAQESGLGAGRFEIGAFPGGGMFFTKSANGAEPDFGNYALGGAVTFNVNRFIGIEGEGGGTIGVRQNFAVGERAFTDTRTPSMWMYSGNLVVNPRGSDHAVVPYVTAGLGGLTICPCGDSEAVGVTSYNSYLTGNVGGGVKWFSTRHFGVRGDYRFFGVRNRDSAPLFFGNENRYGHRVQAGLVFTY